MSEILQFKRGSTGRQLYTPKIAEPLFQVNDKDMYIGDGILAGGLNINNTTSDIPIITSGTYTPTVVFTLGTGTIFSSTGMYIRVGNVVYYTMNVSLRGNFAVSSSFIWNVFPPIATARMKMPSFVMVDTVQNDVGIRNSENFDHLSFYMSGVGDFTDGRFMVYGSYVIV